MYKILSSLLVIAFFAVASAFTPISKPVVNDSKQDAPETMLTINLSQTGPGAALGTWTSSNPNATFIVGLADLNTDTRVQFPPTPDTQMPFTSLIPKHTYRLFVWDGDNYITDDEFIAN